MRANTHTCTTNHQLDKRKQTHIPNTHSVYNNTQSYAQTESTQHNTYTHVPNQTKSNSTNHDAQMRTQRPPIYSHTSETETHPYTHKQPKLNMLNITNTTNRHRQLCMRCRSTRGHIGTSNLNSAHPEHTLINNMSRTPHKRWHCSTTVYRNTQTRHASQSHIR